MLTAMKYINFKCIVCEEQVILSSVRVSFKVDIWQLEEDYYQLLKVVSDNFYILLLTGKDSKVRNSETFSRVPESRFCFKQSHAPQSV